MCLHITQLSRGRTSLNPGNLPPESEFLATSITHAPSIIQNERKRDWMIHYLVHCCCCLVDRSCPTLLLPRILYPSGSSLPWDFPGKDHWSGFHSLLQGIFPLRLQTHVSCIVTTPSRWAIREGLPCISPIKQIFWAPTLCQEPCSILVCKMIIS